MENGSNIYGILSDGFTMHASTMHAKSCYFCFWEDLFMS